MKVIDATINSFLYFFKKNKVKILNKNRCFFILLKFLTIIKANICINHIYFKKNQ